VAGEPAKLDIFTLGVFRKEADFSFSRGKVVSDEANKLHVIQVNDLLRLLLIGKVDHDELSVIECESFIDHQRVVDLDCLLSWFDHATLVMGNVLLVPVQILFLHLLLCVLIEESTDVGVLGEH
jgi:hypothetical protein